MVEGSASPTKSEKGRPGKHKTKDAYRSRDAPNDDKKFMNAWNQMDL